MDICVRGRDNDLPFYSSPNPKSMVCRLRSDPKSSCASVAGRNGPFIVAGEVEDVWTGGRDAKEGAEGIAHWLTLGRVDGPGFALRPLRQAHDVNTFPLPYCEGSGQWHI